MQDVRADRELNCALNKLWDEGTAVWRSTSAHQNMCGGWSEALRNPYGVNIPHYGTLRTCHEVIARHVRKFQQEKRT